MTLNRTPFTTQPNSKERTILRNPNVETRFLTQKPVFQLMMQETILVPSCVNSFSSCYDRVMAYFGTLEKTKGIKSYQVKKENCNFNIKDENIGRSVFNWEWLFHFLGILIAMTS